MAALLDSLAREAARPPLQPANGPTQPSTQPSAQPSAQSAAGSARFSQPPAPTNPDPTNRTGTASASAAVPAVAPTLSKTVPQDTLTSFLSQHKEPETRPAQPTVPAQLTQPEQPRQRPILKEAACQTIELDLPLMSALDSPLAAHRYSHSTTPRPSAIPRRSSRANSMTSSMSRPSGWGVDGPGKPEKPPSGPGDSHEARVLHRRLEHSVKETDQLRRQVLIACLID